MALLAQSNILEDVKNKWRKIGALLCQSNDLDSYEKKAMMDDYECCSKVFQAWIDNDGCPNYSLTWQGLYNVLNAKGVGKRAIAKAALDGMGVEYIAYE